MNNEIIVHSFTPPKYEREIKDDSIIKFLTILNIVIVCIIFFISVNTITYDFKSILYIINFVAIILFSLLDAWWLYYKLQHIIIGIYKLFMDLNIFRTNSKYYSGLEIPDIFIQEKYPNITIQLPVYKEDLENTIKPTIMSAIKEANRYKQETSSNCNIIVCDDGYNLISDDERKKRELFYTEYNIGFSARPHPSKVKRIGRFKKAGNLNFSMNYGRVFTNVSCDINYQCKLTPKFHEMIELGATFKGNLSYGTYIFLIDSDTRFPDFSKIENGCLKRLIKDMLFDGEDTVLYIQCFTGPYLSIKSLSEKCVFHFTCHIYNGILVGTAMNVMAPLVGHNALLNVRILTEIAIKDPDTNYHYYWAEDRISEDFDCMMRGCDHGYIGRYLISSGIYLEGISFNYITEYFKVSKFACGAAELTFNPVSMWFSKGGGFLSSDIIGFIMCKEIEWYNKISILSYILNFMAIAQAHISTFYNLIFFDDLFNIIPFPLLPINLMWEGMIVWGGINTLINIIFSRRVNFNTKKVLVQQIRELFFTSALYGSLSVRFSIMYFTHLFNLEFSFGATQKDSEQVQLIDWIKSTKYECCIYTFYFICILIRLFVFPIKSMIYTFYFGCLPLLMNIFWYWFGPIVYDILPNDKDKTTTNDYDNDTKMFTDKYKTQIPNTKYFISNKHKKCKQNHLLLEII